MWGPSTELRFFSSEDLSALNVEMIPVGYPEMSLGLCARKDVEGFAEAMWLRKVPGRSEDEQAVEHRRNLQDTVSTSTHRQDQKPKGIYSLQPQTQSRPTEFSGVLSEMIT